MKIMILYPPESRVLDIAWAFEECGYEVTSYEENVMTCYESRVEAERTCDRLEQRIREEGVEACFS